MKREPEPQEISIPDWYVKWAESFAKGENQVIFTVLPLAMMNITIVSKTLGGDIKTLPYECLRVLFPNGTENAEVSQLLQRKRTDYLRLHPSESTVGKNISGIIGFNSTVIPMDVWNEMSPDDRVAHLIGNDLSHLR